MAIHTSRYDVGDTVFGLHTTVHRYWKLCPVCGGTNRVAVEGQSGLRAYCPAPDCSSGKVWLEAGSYFEVQELTIGQLRVVAGYEAHVEYMCNETGVGSGRVWKEQLLFPTPEEAEEAARNMGAVTRAELKVP